MMTVQRGRVQLDANGQASVDLPGYWAANNDLPEVQLTACGASMPGLYFEDDPLASGVLRISGGVPFKSVSWQVTAARSDAWAKANLPLVEDPKDPKHVGKYLHPELHGATPDKTIHTPPAKATHMPPPQPCDAEVAYRASLSSSGT
jgi:hypothetical protein